jgi:hypothetical protein
LFQEFTAHEDGRRGSISRHIVLIKKKE